MDTEKIDKPWRFQPGQSGNPSGRPVITKEERTMRENFQKSFAMLGTKSIAEIQAIAKDPNQPAPYALAAKALEWAFKKGNPALYREIWDRTVGKVKQDVEFSGHLEMRPYKELSDDELRKRIEDAAGRTIIPTRSSKES